TVENWILGLVAVKYISDPIIPLYEVSLTDLPAKSRPIIESKSKVCYSRNKPVVAKVSTNTSTSGISPDVVELKDMVKALLLNKKSQNQAPATVTAVEESCLSSSDDVKSNLTSWFFFRSKQSECSTQSKEQSKPFQSKSKTRKQFQSRTCLSTLDFPPFSLPSSAYQALAPQTQGVLKKYFSTYVKANDAVMRNMQTQGQNMQNQLTNLTELLTKFVNSNSASTSSSGTLPSNTIANSRSDLKAITTRSGFKSRAFSRFISSFLLDGYGIEDFRLGFRPLTGAVTGLATGLEIWITGVLVWTTEGWTSSVIPLLGGVTVSFVASGSFFTTLGRKEGEGGV
nr:hypothetical protein [Tanacetum cinerariifolium]